jgi:hypothetical protein
MIRAAHGAVQLVSMVGAAGGAGQRNGVGAGVEVEAREGCEWYARLADGDPTSDEATLDEGRAGGNAAAVKMEAGRRRSRVGREAQQR